MELRQLEHFLAVAEERHFTRASELLHITQSGLSASIRALEDELGAALFVRSTRRVELTAAGAALLEQAHHTIRSAAAARSAVQAVSGIITGEIAVGAEQCIGTVHLTHELASFRRRHPGVSITLTIDGTTTLLDKVETGRLDLAVLAPVGPPPDGIRLDPVGTERLVVLSRPDHRVARRTSVTLSHLREETFIALKGEWSARILATRAFAAANLDYRVDLEVNDVHTMLDLIQEDLGIAVVPEYIARKRPDQLHATTIDGATLEWTCAVATRRSPNPAAATLRKQLLRSATLDHRSPAEQPSDPRSDTRVPTRPRADVKP